MVAAKAFKLQTCCFEIAVTCAQASAQDAFVKRIALHLVQCQAVFLAETITGPLQRVLTHPARGLVDETNAALLTQKFWSHLREVEDMVVKEESVSDAESGWSGVSDNSSTDSECTDVEASSVASDQDRFDTACDAFRDLADVILGLSAPDYPT